MKILFLHGWRSVPGGVKPTYLAQHGHEVINPALPDEDFAKAVRIAQEEFDKYQPDVVVGSSRGGAVAMSIESGDTPLVLLCPAWKNWGTARTVKKNTVILHSRADDVVPFADSEELVKRFGATLIEVGTDHRMADPEPLRKMLETCQAASHKGDQHMAVAFQKTIPILRIFDVEKAKDFYVGLLGFTVDWEHHFEANTPAYIQVSRDGLTLHLSEHHGDCCPGSTVFVWMTGIEEFHQEITAKGYKYLGPGIETTFYDAKCVQVIDPFGNRIRFNEDLKTNKGE
jgi:catechol 2,3-dioxygenase-like lactoylglutathione lyase family enzyme